jgi:hypothetical protein
MYRLSPSKTKFKKYDVITPEQKKISFGDNRYSDYTQHHDDDRKHRYLIRHHKTEDWRDLDSAGCWSRWILWNETTILKSIDDMEKRFKIHIVFH